MLVIYKKMLSQVAYFKTSVSLAALLIETKTKV